MAWHQMAAFNCVGLVARVASDQVRDSLLTVEQLLLSKGVEIVVEQVSADALGGNSREVASLEEMGARCDLLIAVGGDGNILSAARVMAPFGVPILGINRGKLGFLADVSPDEIEARLSEVLSGDYTRKSIFCWKGRLQVRKICPVHLMKY